MEIAPPAELNNPLVVPHNILMGPGPSNAAPRILQAMSQPVLGHMDPVMSKIMDDIKKGIQYIFQTKNELTLAISASGHSGMEAIFCNLSEPGDTVLIASNGFWGYRAFTIAKRYGAVAKWMIRRKPTDYFTLIELENAVKDMSPKILFLVQGDSSTGICQSLEGIGEITRRYNCLLAVDSVASLGSVPLFMDAWKIDVLYSGCQKIIGVPPGLAPISFSQRAQDVIFKRKSKIPVFYWDMTLLGQQWNCFEKKIPRFYHHTTSANLLYALREGLAVLAEEGLENVIKRHQDCAAQLYKGLEQLGLEFYIEEKHRRLPSVTTIKIPANIDWKEVVQYAMKNYQLEISGGIGPSAGKVFRIGIMGYNATPEKVSFTLKVLKEALEHYKYHSKL